VIVGGAQMFGGAGRMQVGQRNEEAVRAALLVARIPIVAAETGGGSGRTIRVYIRDMCVTARVAGGTESPLVGKIAVTA
jgi:chemotaxis protein CheD